MDNPNNRLITKDEVENILNYFQNIGDEGTLPNNGIVRGTFLKINKKLEPFGLMLKATDFKQTFYKINIPALQKAL